VVGAGPCGIAVGAAAKAAGLQSVLFDKGCLTSSLVSYPYYMSFFSTAERLEIGSVPFTIPDPKPTRREALAYYRRVVEHFALDVRQYQDVVEVSGKEGDYRLKTRRLQGDEETFSARAVAIATGSFGKPNLLGIPGEDLPKVVHRYQEPYPFHNQDVLVVGGGNSAVEAALDLFRNGARVTLAHFADWIDPGIKPWVVPDIENRLKKDEICAYWEHRVVEIRPRSVILHCDADGSNVEVVNDWVLALTGWHADMKLLKGLSVAIDPESGVPRHDKATMETNVPGIFIAGVLAGGNDPNKIFIENGREHGALIVDALLARSGQLTRPGAAS
jgi:thioredoxin reductase (NADPH)